MRSLNEGGISHREAEVPLRGGGVPSEKRVLSNKGVHALEAVPSQKRKP